MNRTPNMNLVLYEANDIMDGTEFINANNTAIDEYTSQVKTTAETANAAAIQANQGVGAADTKITAINTRLDNDQIDNLPGFISATDSRLESLEDSVGSFSEPYTDRVLDLSGNTLTSFYISGGMLFMEYAKLVGTSYASNSLPIKDMNNGDSITQLPYKSDFGQLVGNPFNLKPNVIYSEYVLARPAATMNATVVIIGIYYNNVNTYICQLSDSNAVTVVNGSASMPVGKLKEYNVD